MRRVTGIGGIFFRSRDPEATRAWYRRHLGVRSGDHGGTFEWRHAADAGRKGFTVWSPLPPETDYFGDGGQAFMLNYRVEDLGALLETLRQEGVEVVKEPEEYEYGRFAWILDPDGRRVELWEPVDPDFEEILDDDATNPSA